MSELAYKRTNVYEVADEKLMKAIFDYAEGYKTFQPHGLQPTRLLHPWDFPGKSTGVGCHCLLRLLS